MHLFPDARGDCHVREHPRHRPHFGSSHKAVVVLWNIFRNLNRVFPNGSKRLRQFFAAVNAHGITSLWDLPPYRGADADFDAPARGYVTPLTYFFVARSWQETDQFSNYSSLLVVSPDWLSTN